MALHDIQVSQGPTGTTLALTGEVDLSAVEDVQARVAEALEAQPEVLVFDLRELDFLDSSGLRVVLRADQDQREAGRRLVVVRGGRRVDRVFELTGAETRIEMVDDPAEI